MTVSPVDRAAAYQVFDHVGLMFSVAAQALEHEDEAVVALGSHLTEQALDPWVATFGASLQKQALTPLYRGIGALIVALHASAPRTRSSQPA